MKKICFLLFLIYFFVPSFAQSHISQQSHQDRITKIIPSRDANERTFFTAGEDGFIVDRKSVV